MSNLPEKWPVDHNAMGVNEWNSDAAGFVKIVQDNPNFWWFDHELKYLNVRIDTRDGGFVLFCEKKGSPNGAGSQRVSPDRVLAAIRKYRLRFNEPTPEAGSDGKGEK